MPVPENSIQDPIRIAIVEDDNTIRDGLKMLINGSYGFSCIGAFGSAEDAIANMPEPHPDVVLMDINLPGMNGIDCLIELKEKDPSIQFIMLTVFENTDVIFKSLSAGASGYLLKQTPPSKLLDAILDVYNGGSPMSGEIARKVVQSFQYPVKNHTLEYSLSTREEEILSYLVKGFFYKEIADQLNISVETVRTHIRNIYEKLQVRTRSEAILKYFNK